MQWLYLILAIIGAIVPFSYLFTFLSTRGFDIPELFRQLFQNNVSAAFGSDVIICFSAIRLHILGRKTAAHEKSLGVRALHVTGRRILWLALVSFLPRAQAQNRSDDKSDTLRQPGISEDFKGKACLYINKLADVDLTTLRKLVEKSVERMADQRIDK
jgi:hypothetical protein